MDPHDAHLRETTLERAEALLPKYGGLTAGALNQACLLLGWQPTREEWRSMERELEARTHE